LDIEYYRDLEMCVRGHSRSLKSVPSLGAVSYSPSVVTMAVSKNGVTFKTRLGVVQGHWKWRRSMRLSIGRPL